MNLGTPKLKQWKLYHLAEWPLSAVPTVRFGCMFFMVWFRPHSSNDKKTLMLHHTEFHSVYDLVPLVLWQELKPFSQHNAAVPRKAPTEMFSWDECGRTGLTLSPLNTFGINWNANCQTDLASQRKCYCYEVALIWWRQFGVLICVSNVSPKTA